MSDPKRRNIEADVDAMPAWQRALIPTLLPDYVVPSLDDEMPEPKP